MPKKKYLTKKNVTILLILFMLLIISLWVTTSGLHAFGISIPKGYNIHGIDVSRYQGKINWDELEKMKEGKDKIQISFAFLKATEGRSIQDPTFKTNWANVGKTGIIRGAYHFFIPTRSAEEQAQNFIANVKLAKGDLPPVLDVEQLGKQGAAKLRENIKIWLTTVEKHYGMKPIIYTYIDFYEKNLIDDELKKYPLWVAHYYAKKIKVKEPWLFWQHSDRGKIDGIKEKTDFNVFNGSMKQLKSLCKK